MGRRAGISMGRLEGEQLFEIRSPAKLRVCSEIGAFLGGEMRFNLSLPRFLFFSLFLTFSGITVRAQSDRGTIAGTVLDSSGGVVADASVTATDTATSATYSATTRPTGGYPLYHLRVAGERLSGSAPGFQTVD